MEPNNKQDFDKTITDAYLGPVKRESAILNSQTLEVSLRKSVLMKSTMSVVLEYLKPNRQVDCSEKEITKIRYSNLMKKCKNNYAAKYSQLKEKMEKMNLYDVESSLEAGIPNVNQVQDLRIFIERVNRMNDEGREKMLEQYDKIVPTITHFRRIAGDGNCFYRSVMFGYLEKLVMKRDLLTLRSIAIDMADFVRDLDPFIRNGDISMKAPYEKCPWSWNIMLLDIVIESLERCRKEQDLKETHTKLIKCFNMFRFFDIVSK